MGSPTTGIVSQFPDGGTLKGSAWSFVSHKKSRRCTIEPITFGCRDGNSKLRTARSKPPLSSADYRRDTRWPMYPPAVLAGFWPLLNYPLHQPNTKCRLVAAQRCRTVTRLPSRSTLWKLFLVTLLRHGSFQLNQVFAVQPRAHILYARKCEEKIPDVGDDVPGYQAQDAS